MPEKLPLATLIELAQSKTDDATRRLGQLQNAQLGASAKLDMLVQYRQEYLEQYNGQMAGGLTASQMCNFQNFIATLDGAIEQQRAVMLQANTRLGHGRTDWQSNKRRLSSFGTLADRVRQFEIGVANKKEQRDSDERSARQFFMRITALAD
jgi:flagellar FliJ protein